METPSVAVVICAYTEKRLAQLIDAIESAKNQTQPPDSVVVVVDCNAELTREVTARVTDISVVALERRTGLAGARNAGVAACESDIILFLDDDAVAEPTWVARLAEAIALPNVLGASGSSVPIWPDVAPTWVPEEYYWTLGASYRGQPTVRTAVRNVYGGCCGLRRSLFTELSGYDPRLGRGPLTHGGGEEAELCLRAQRRWPAAVFLYEPGARIHHHVTPDRLRVRYLLRRSYDEGRMKAAVARLQPGGLAPERDFALQIPLAFLRYLLRGIAGDRANLAKAATLAVLSMAVALGLADATNRFRLRSPIGSE
jgi:glycosyltransferase involved in cell wall biosynthesis